AIVHMRCESRLVFATQTVRNERREAANDDAFGVNHDPLLFDFAGFRGIGGHAKCPNSTLWSRVGAYLRQITGSVNDNSPKTPLKQHFRDTVSYYLINQAVCWDFPLGVRREDDSTMATSARQVATV